MYDRRRLGRGVPRSRDGSARYRALSHLPVTYCDNGNGNNSRRGILTLLVVGATTLPRRKVPATPVRGDGLSFSRRRRAEFRRMRVLPRHAHPL